MKGKLEYTKLYPAMFNSPEHVEKAKALLEEALGLDKIKLMIRRAGGEDFPSCSKPNRDVCSDSVFRMKRIMLPFTIPSLISTIKQLRPERPAF